MESTSSDKKHFEAKGWLKLDNCAKLFPAITNGELTSVFRITVHLKKPVRYSALKKATEVTAARYPYFSVSLGSGLFWHFLSFIGKPPRIHTEEEVPCTAFAVRKSKEPLYRILAKENRISVEFIHILTDGTGALELLKTLLFVYFGLTGNEIVNTEGIILPDSEPDPEELEDGYNRFFKKVPSPPKQTRAWHLPFTLNEKPRLKILRAVLPAGNILEAARKHKVSVTEYLASVFLFALHNIYIEEKSKKRQRHSVLRIEVPVNLRNKFPSRTLRNFSLFVMPEIDLRLGTYTFDEIVKVVHHKLQMGSETKQISRFLSSNVSHERSLFIRVLPLFIKKLAIASIYKSIGSKQCSGIITNLGITRLPVEMSELTESIEIIPPPPNKKVKVSCGVVTYNDKMMMCFANISKSRELERNVLNFLSSAGINVRILKS